MEASSSGETSDAFYAILNVPRDASEDDIKKAFRQLAQAYHPDKHTDPALKAHAAAQFTLLQEAYEVSGYISCLHCHLLAPIWYLMLCVPWPGT